MAKLFQVSTASALNKGNYDYSISIEYFLKNGDTGLGTFNGLNGEAIFLDGKSYNGTANGYVKEMTIPQTGVSYGLVTKFNNEVTPLKLEPSDSINSLIEKLNPVFTRGQNYFYAVKITGVFSKVTIRSFFKQQKPYRPISEVIKDQKEFTYENEEGTLIGFFTPSLFSNINNPGWHFHYISKDLKHGGHVLDAYGISLSVLSNCLDKWEIKLPTNKEFSSLKLD